jgi:hypothetical protein
MREVENAGIGEPSQSRPPDRRRETGSIFRFASPRNADKHEAGTIGSLPASASRAHP